MNLLQANERHSQDIERRDHEKQRLLAELDAERSARQRERGREVIAQRQEMEEVQHRVKSAVSNALRGADLHSTAERDHVAR